MRRGGVATRQRKGFIMGTIVSCRIQSYGKHTDLVWDHLPALGIHHVEMPIPKPDERDATRERLEASGLEVASFQGACDLSDEQVADAIAPQCEACRDFGCDRLFLSVKAGELDRQVAYDRLRAAGEQAGKHGVILMLETHPDLVTNGDVGAETMQAVDHPHVRINFDTANIYYYNQGRETVNELNKVIAYVEGVHLKDTHGQYKEFNFPTLGMGVVDFARVIELLSERDYSGPYTMELEGVEGVEMTPEQQKHYVADSAAYLRQIGLLTD